MRLNKYMGMILVLTSFASCTNEELPDITWENDPSAIRIQAMVGNEYSSRTNPVGTTQEELTFNTDDRISLSSQNGKAIYTYSNNSWNPLDEIYLKWAGASMNIEAVYPANDKTTITNFNILTDQSAKNLIASSDYMTFRGNCQRKELLSIPMTRRTARIIVKINFSNEFEGSTPNINNLRIKGYTSIENNNSTSLDFINPYKLTGEGINTPTYVALVAPNPTGKKDEVFITLDVNGASYIVRGLPQVDSKKSYTFNVKVGKYKIDIAGITIEDWKNKSVLPNDGGSISSMKTNTKIDLSTHTITTTQAGTINYGMILNALNGGNELKIVGPINGKDIQALRTAAGCPSNTKVEGYKANEQAPLSVLDLKDAKIMTSNDVYFHLNSENYTTTNTHIGKKMFYYSNLTKVTLPSDIITIDNYAFTGSKKLNGITINKNVTTIDESAFYFNLELSSLIFEAGGTESLTIRRGVFHYAPLSTTKNLVLPERLVSLGDQAFYETNLESVKIEEGDRELFIGYETFYNSRKLKTLTIPRRTKHIGKGIVGSQNNIKTPLESITILAPYQDEDKQGTIGISKDIFLNFRNAPNCVLTLHKSWDGNGRITTGSTGKKNKLFGLEWKEIKLVE